MKIYSNIRLMLRTVRPVNGTIGLRCSVEEAERTWYNDVSYNDRKDFELVVESAPHGCNVFVRPWSESGMLVGGESALVEWVVIMVVCAAFWGVVIYYV